MRQLAICLFTLLIGLPAFFFGVIFAQAESTTSQAKAPACQAKATACKCEATACQTNATTCQAAAIACQADSTACQAKFAGCKIGHAVCAGCPSDDKITHLQKAAKHLQAAGMELEAEHGLEVAKALRCDLLEQKIAELERLQAEVHALQRATGQLQPSTTRK